MSFKRLFSASLSAAPGRLHMAAHSHHLWPDASRVGQLRCWDDAAALADTKWDTVMGEVWPEAAAGVSAELGLGTAAWRQVVFAANTHDLIVRLVAACPRGAGGALRILTTDGEFHSARRQFARWLEAGEIAVETVPVEPFDNFAERFLEAASSGAHDMIFVSHVLFGSGRIVDPVDPICELARPEGPWVAVDGYHAFMALEHPFSRANADKAFYLGGGYKYAMAGEGMGFMTCPPGFGPRPPITGWFAEFEDLTLPPGMVGYAEDAMRFMGATFDPSALYRWNAIRGMLIAEAIDVADTNAHVAELHEKLVDGLGETVFAGADLLNPLDGHPHARFLAYRHADAARWCDELKAKDCITDVRGDVLRVGLGLYHDEADIDRFVAMAKGLA
ncbi:aminotransferase class V-fold PLP-dependent enzyme [Sphingomicrobium nitratireducens]|uniref:aminotransferase class V-fold PLP-dependent enzyme n=1 Tax=Sphingomicrobium nitratireducens TaxID=2964666 RepID=UPI00223ED7A1|nr:aminotransferase class V-fold PLP-dependent enzyme [Sphingomicrobium nitratireducens]